MDIDNLKKKIIQANTAYRNGESIMDDLEFDALVEQYRNSVNESEYSIFRDSLHESTGKIRHPFIMGSLNKLKIEEPDSIKKFIKNNIHTKISVSAKIDGISCRLHYENGNIVSASTRGDGTFGIDITDKIMFVRGIPKCIEVKDNIDIRGELVILKKDFSSMNGFSNPRNACAGIFNRKDWNKLDVGMVSFIAYTVLGENYSKEEQFNLLEKNNFDVAWHKSYVSSEYLSENFIDTLFNLADSEYQYETDGLVICDETYRNEKEYRPSACVAVKINQLKASTKIIDVSWDGPSKNGVFCPVAVIAPIELGGSTISRATLHNLDFIADKNLKYGSEISICKSGDVIPKVLDVLKNDDSCTEIQMPKECPCCGSKLIVDGVNLKCVNKNCRDQKIHQITHFIKKMGVMNASFKTLDNFGIDTYDALLTFQASPKYKSQTKFIEELYSKIFSKSKHDLFCALDIEGVGEILQNKIVEHLEWDMIEKFVKSSDDARVFFRNKLVVLPDGIGEITMSKFMESCRENAGIVLKFANDVRWHGDKMEKQSSVRKNGSMCFTGSLNTLSRGQAFKLAEAAGYEVKSGVSRGLTYLITNDVNSGSSKNKKAAAYGTKIIDEKEFLRLVDPSNNVEDSSIMEM